MNRREHIIWAAGFLDGEGFIGISRGISTKTGKPCHQVIIDVAQARRAPLDVLVTLFGGKVRLGKVAYNWRLTGYSAQAVLVSIHPYLIAKTQQATLCLEYCATLCGHQGRVVTSEVLQQREALHAALRELNSTASSHAERLSERAPLTIAVNG